MTGRIAAVGDLHSILPFQTVGVETHVVNSPEEATAVVETLEQEGCALLLITEDLAGGLGEGSCARLLIPGKAGPTGQGKAAIDRAVLQAIGTKL